MGFAEGGLGFTSDAFLMVGCGAAKSSETVVRAKRRVIQKAVHRALRSPRVATVNRAAHC
jgi:hypothetical protein